MSQKPILFNTQMVRALLEGRKKVTRRVVKPQPLAEVKTLYRIDETDKWRSHGVDWWYEFRAPCVPGDVLWVRETFRVDYLSNIVGSGRVQYKADGSYADIHFSADRYDMMRRAQRKPGWRPNENMPREAARIFLRVTGVRVERLQDITPDQIDAEGCKEWSYSATTGKPLPSGPSWFRIAWDNTIKSADRATCGWEANLWVWVIEFEQISKEEAINGA